MKMLERSTEKMRATFGDKLGMILHRNHLEQQKDPRENTAENIQITKRLHQHRQLIRKTTQKIVAFIIITLAHIC